MNNPSEEPAALRRSDLMLSTAYRKPEDETGETIAQIWQNVLRVDRIGLDDDFFEFGGDSLGASVLASEMESRFGCKFSPSKLMDASSVAAQVAYIKRQKETRNAIPSNLIVCHAAGKKPPLFIVHGGIGFTIYDKRFLEGIDNDQPIIFIEAPGLDGKEAPLESVETMAGHYLRSMRQVAPEGNWLLAANCAGGLIAMEMWRQAQVAGENVSRLMLIDPGSHLFKTARQIRRLRWKKFWRAPMPKRFRSGRKKLWRAPENSDSGDGEATAYEASLDARRRKQSRLETLIRIRVGEQENSLVPSQTAYSSKAMRRVSRSFSQAVQNYVASRWEERIFVLRSIDSRRDEVVLNAYLPVAKTRIVPYDHAGLFTDGLPEVQKFMSDVISAESWEAFTP